MMWMCGTMIRTSYVNGSYTVKSHKVLGGLLGGYANYEFLPVGDRIPMGSEFGWWRPTQSWAHNACVRYTRKDHDQW